MSMRNLNDIFGMTPEEVIGYILAFGGLIATTIILGTSFKDIEKNNDEIVYKQGQIDALTGNVKYELIKHDDGTVTWERITNANTD